MIAQNSCISNQTTFENFSHQMLEDLSVLLRILANQLIVVDSVTGLANIESTTRSLE